MLSSTLSWNTAGALPRLVNKVSRDYSSLLYNFWNTRTSQGMMPNITCIVAVVQFSTGLMDAIRIPTTLWVSCLVMSSILLNFSDSARFFISEWYLVPSAVRFANVLFWKTVLVPPLANVADNLNFCANQNMCILCSGALVSQESRQKLEISSKDPCHEVLICLCLTRAKCIR